MTVATSASAPSIGFAARGATVLVRAYQRLTAHRPSPCRYVPTCSSYALDAYELHGFVRGSWLTAKRIGRCHPWASSGWDPVPGSPPSSHDHGPTDDHVADTGGSVR
jgi:uncharacterized protein